MKLGPSEGEAIAILSGLAAGERVVEGPYRVLKLLEDGDKVKLETPRGEDDQDKDKDKKDKNGDGAKKDGTQP